MKIDPIIKALLKHNRSFERLSNGDILVRAIDPNAELALEIEASDWNPSIYMLEVNSWFGVKPTTVWDIRWQRKWKEIVRDFNFNGTEWTALKWYYSESKCPYLRKDIGTLLNNWQGEVTRADNYDPEADAKNK